MSERKLPDNCETVFTTSQIQQALDQLAQQLNSALAGQTVVALCVMNGGLIFTGQLLTRLQFETTIDYCHATRYRNTTSGNTLQWLSRPQQSLQDKTVLIFDDILDEGVTLKAVRDYCYQQGASCVITVVLLEKRHHRRVEDIEADFVALRVEDKYVFGFGMDYEGRYRNLDAIYALGEQA